MTTLRLVTSTEGMAARPRSARPPKAAPPESLAERVLRSGTSALTDEELLALVLQTGPSAGIAPAASILRDCGGLAGLPVAAPGDFLCDGVGPTRSASLLASLELARRLAREEVPSRAPLSRPEAVATYLNLRYRLRDQEVMGAIFLDARNQLISDQEIFRGTLHRVAVEPRPILREALLRGASSVVLFHTHPSGDPTPSLDDLAFTRRMAEAGEAVGVSLQDHLILGSSGRWVSLRERGAW